MFSLFNLYVVKFLVGVVSISATFIVLYYKWRFGYWKKRGLTLDNEPRIPIGTFRASFGKLVHFGIYGKWCYEKGKSFKHIGAYFFDSPKYLVFDPDYIRNVLQKDSQYFSRRRFYYDEKNDPLSANMFALNGEKWKKLRTQLSPAFTGGKIKMMFPGIVRCADNMIKAVGELAEKRVDVKDFGESYTIDVIGSCGFGLDCNSFKDPNAEFKLQAKEAFHMPTFRLFKIFLAFTYPKIARIFGITLFTKETNRFFTNVVKESIRFRENNAIERQDILQLLLNTRSEDDKGLSIEEITAQVFIFFAAGYETSSLTLTYCLYELSLNTEIQDIVRDEVCQVLKGYDNNITYDAIMEMKYLDQVIDETLRKYPPLPFITRECVKDYTVPGTNITIGKGVETVVQILGLHHDPEFYPEPDKFMPERFCNAEKQQRRPCTYLPFGEGHRICIGQRLGLLQTKVGVAALIRNFKFSINKNTDVPLKIDPYSFTFQPCSKVILDVEKVKQIEN